MWHSTKSCHRSICIAVDSTTVRRRAFESTNTAAVNKLINRTWARADEAKAVLSLVNIPSEFNAADC